MGRGPSSHPPGKERSASPIRPKMAPRKITEERISRIRAWGTSQRTGAVASTVTVVPSWVTRQPRWRRISREAVTSDRGGQLWITLVPGARMAAARMGRALFFAPWTRTVPLSGRPPSTIKALMDSVLRNIGLLVLQTILCRAEPSVKNLISASEPEGSCRSARWHRAPPCAAGPLPWRPASPCG